MSMALTQTHGNDADFGVASDSSTMDIRHGFFYSYNAVFDLDISAHAKLLYLYLCRCADSQARSFPSRKKMAAALSISLTSVHNAVVELESAGVLKREPYYRRDGGQTSNTYTLFNPNDIQQADEAAVSEVERVPSCETAQENECKSRVEQQESFLDECSYNGAEPVLIAFQKGIDSVSCYDDNEEGDCFSSSVYPPQKPCKWGFIATPLIQMSPQSRSS